MTARTIVITGLPLGVAAAIAQEPIQLDESCTVTVGNQTAIVRPGGTVFVRNISCFSRATIRDRRPQGRRT